MARLVLVDTAHQLPGLLPLHGWSALMSSELVLVGAAEHPFVPHLDMAELRTEVVADGSPKERADTVVERAREHGEVTYLFGPADDDGFTGTLGMEAARAGVEVEVVYFGAAPKGLELLRLVEVETRLRGPGGCPWDLEQTHESLARYAVEELYELVEAISTGEEEPIKEELGDLLLQVVFHAQIAEDAGAYTIDDVARGIADKLVRRHPHVFTEVEDITPDEVKARWDELKAAEKPEREGLFDGVPSAQPALAYAEKIQQRAGKQGIEADSDPAARIHAAVHELTSAGAADDAFGDLLFAAVALARELGIDPELALRGAVRRFRERVERA